MLDSSLDLIDLLSSEGIILYISPNVRQILGYEPEQMVGKSCFDFIHPEDQSPLQAALTNATSEPQSKALRYRTRRADGSWCWLESVGSNLLLDKEVNAIIVHSRDITEQVTTQQALHHAHDELRSMLNSVTDAFSIIDRDWRVVFLNEAGEKLLGKTVEELGELSIWDHFPEVVGTSFYDAYQKAMNEQVQVDIEDYAPFFDKWFDITIYPFENGITAYARDVTRRKKAEVERQELLEEVQTERIRLQSVLKNLPVAVILAEAPSGKLIMGNDQVGNIWRQPFRPSPSINDYARWQGFHPDGRPYEGHEWPLARTVAHGEVVLNEEITILRGDGTHGIISNSSMPIYGRSGEIVAGIITFYDITELKETERRLQEETETLETINQLGHLISAELDLEKLVQAVTDAATELSGAQFGAFFYNTPNHDYMLYTLSGVPREAFSKFPMPRATDLFAHTFNGVSVVRSEDVLQDERYGKMAPHFGMPEGHLPVRSYLAVPVISRSGEVLGGLFFGHGEPGIFTERAERIVAALAAQTAIAMDNAHLFQSVQSEREAAEKARRAAEAAQRAAEEASRAKDEFLAVVSHELRTPLNAIVGWSGMLNSGRLDIETAKQALETIERNARSQSQLIDDLLDVSRVVSGKMRVETHPVQMAPVVEAALDAVRPAAQAKSLQLQWVLDPWIGEVSGDSTRLQQIVWNLLSNAVKFTPQGGKITVELRREDAQICFSVTDTGIGIAPEFLPYVFDRFRQADSATTRRFNGLGLGLSIVRHLVELHGGTVEAQSEGLNQGSTFTVHLPALKKSAAPLKPHSRGTNGSTHSHVPGSPREGVVAIDKAQIATRIAGNQGVLQHVRVLIVEDEPDSRAIVQAILEAAGAEVEAAESGEQAQEILKTWHPQVIVSDIGMPREDGYQFIERIRSRRDDIRDVPAIALTAYARAEDKERALLAGFQLHLSKPVAPHEIVQAIDSLVKRP